MKLDAVTLGEYRLIIVISFGILPFLLEERVLLVFFDQGNTEVYFL
jgi:hypothetical protein